MRETDRTVQLWVRRGESIGRMAKGLSLYSGRIGPFVSSLVGRLKYMTHENLHRSHPSK